MTSPMSYAFRLYVAGDADNSVHARANLAALCRTYLPDRHVIELVDVLKEPLRALADGIFMTPMLVTTQPPSVRPIVGNLSRTDAVLRALGLDGPAP